MAVNSFKYGRWHHHVNYDKFRNARLILKDNYLMPTGVNNFKVDLVRLKKDDDLESKLCLISPDSFSLFKTKGIGANATEQLITEPIVMMENEVLQVTAATANRLHVTLSVLEINRD